MARHGPPSRRHPRPPVQARGLADVEVPGDGGHPEARGPVGGVPAHLHRPRARRPARPLRRRPRVPRGAQGGDVRGRDDARRGGVSAVRAVPGGLDEGLAVGQPRPAERAARLRELAVQPGPPRRARVHPPLPLRRPLHSHEPRHGRPPRGVQGRDLARSLRRQGEERLPRDRRGREGPRRVALLDPLRPDAAPTLGAARGAVDRVGALRGAQPVGRGGRHRDAGPTRRGDGPADEGPPRRREAVEHGPARVHLQQAWRVGGDAH